MSPVLNKPLGKPAGSSVKMAPFSSAAGAMFAPVVNRLHVYKVAVTPGTRAYMDAMMALPAWQDWSAQAQAETCIIDKYEIASNRIRRRLGFAHEVGRCRRIAPRRH
jgi:hypothetical protein